MSLHQRPISLLLATVLSVLLVGCGSGSSGESSESGTGSEPDFTGTNVTPATEPPALFRIASTTEDLSVRINRPAINGTTIDVIIYESGNALYYLKAEEEESRLLLYLTDTICSMDNTYRLDKESLSIQEKLEVVVELNSKDCTAENRNDSVFRNVTFNQFGLNVELSEPASVSGSSTWFIDIDEDNSEATAGTLKFDELDQVLRLLSEELEVLWEYEFDFTTQDFEAYYVNQRLTVMRQNENIFVRPPSVVLAARSEQDVFALLATPNYELENYIPGAALLCWSSNGEDIVIKDGHDFLRYNEDTSEFDLYARLDDTAPNTCDFSLLNDGSLLYLADVSEESDGSLFSLLAYDPSTGDRRTLVRDQYLEYRLFEQGIYVNASNDEMQLSAHYLDHSLLIRSFQNSHWMHIRDERTEQDLPLLVSTENLRSEAETNELLLESPFISVFDESELNGKGFLIGQVAETVTLKDSSGVIATSRFGVLNFRSSTVSPSTVRYSFDPLAQGSASKL